MKFAYADPPYIGQAKRHYGCEEINHEELIAMLCRDFPDGWALSCTSNSLRILLPVCPEDLRVAAWVKPFCAYKRGVRPAYAWEPLLFRGGRNRNAPVPEKGGKAITPKDFHSANITLRKGLVGAKPESFCTWVLDLLNVWPDDDMIDLFPGTRVMGRMLTERQTILRAKATISGNSK